MEPTPFDYPFGSKQPLQAWLNDRLQEAGTRLANRRCSKTARSGIGSGSGTTSC